MEKVDYLSEEDVIDIGRRIGESFVAEQDGIVKNVPKEDVIKAFEIMTEYYYKSGVLFTTSDNHEGFLAYWHKNTKINAKGAVHMMFRLLKEIPLRSVVRVAEGADELYAKLYKKEKDYVAVSMVVVLKEYQGKGYMHKILEHPFQEARSQGIPCVLDTDTLLKVEKYKRCGMKKVGMKKLKSGQYLYVMEYR